MATGRHVRACAYINTNVQWGNSDDIKVCINDNETEDVYQFLEYLDRQ